MEDSVPSTHLCILTAKCWCQVATEAWPPAESAQTSSIGGMVLLQQLLQPLLQVVQVEVLLLLVATIHGIWPSTPS